jgi:hypothetical protein
MSGAIPLLLLHASMAYIGYLSFIIIEHSKQCIETAKNSVFLIGGGMV